MALDRFKCCETLDTAYTLADRGAKGKDFPSLSPRPPPQLKINKNIDLS
jgi:hypothetical protein